MMLSRIGVSTLGSLWGAGLMVVVVVVSAFVGAGSVVVGGRGEDDGGPDWVGSGGAVVAECERSNRLSGVFVCGDRSAVGLILVPVEGVVVSSSMQCAWHLAVGGGGVAFVSGGGAPSCVQYTHAQSQVLVVCQTCQASVARCGGATAVGTVQG